MKQYFEYKRESGLEDFFSLKRIKLIGKSVGRSALTKFKKLRPDISIE